LITKYISISNDMLINLLNIVVESNDEFNLMYFDKAIKCRFFDEPVLSDSELQSQFVELIKDRFNNKDKYYIIEKYRDYKIYELLEEGFKRRENYKFNESSTMTYFKEKIESYLLLKHSQEIISSVKSADQNMSLGVVNDKDLVLLKNNIFNLLDDLTFESDFGELTLGDTDQFERNRISMNLNQVVPTFLEELNDITDGGACPKELHLVAMGTGVGKSVFLCNIGHRAFLDGKNIYHFTMELDRFKTMIRYYSLFTGIAVKELKRMPIEEVSQRLSSFTKEMGDNLIIKEYPSGTCTKHMLSLYIQRKVLVTGKKPGLIIVDYADEMKITNIKKDRHDLEMGNIFRELRCLAGENMCPVWTASQITREGQKKVESKVIDLSESSYKGNVSDLILIARQSDEERIKNKFRLFVAKNRSGIAGKEIKCKYDYVHMKIEEDDEIDVQDFSKIDFGNTDKSPNSV